jgi:predicted nucleic acid-binding Zn ribbon protein
MTCGYESLDSGVPLAVASVRKCEVCGKRLTPEQVAVAASRGTEARYCSTTCRSTAAKRRQRAK